MKYRFKQKLIAIVNMIVKIGATKYMNKLVYIEMSITYIIAFCTIVRIGSCAANIKNVESANLNNTDFLLTSL